jgi:hypothetical protein
LKATVDLDEQNVSQFQFPLPAFIRSHWRHQIHTTKKKKTDQHFIISGGKLP